MIFTLRSFSAGLPLSSPQSDWLLLRLWGRALIAAGPRS